MIVSSLPLAQAIVQHFKHFGIQNIVISPGSRNAPLTLSFANDPFFKCYSIADERAAAFFALGMAQQLRFPVAVACTSGSALLNYYPAIAESFYSRIPLIVLSADRPPDKIDIGDGQTIRQDNVFANHIIFSKTLNENDDSDNDNYIHQALKLAITQKGPVHLNIPFEEPLYDVVGEIKRPFKPKTFQQPTFQNKISDEVLNIWQSANKKMILVGDLFPNTLNNTLLNQLLDDESIVFLSEKNSNLHHKKIIDQIDVLITPLNEDDFDNLKPDVLLTFGGMIVSKRIKAFLRQYKPKHHIHVDELRAYDTFFSLSHHVINHPQNFINEIIKCKNKSSNNYQTYWVNVFKERQEKAKLFTKDQPFSDFVAFGIILNQIPENYHLQIGNSSPIRYLQLFETKQTWEIFCNRGTSGIDGSTSTAVGASLINSKPTCLITGDISFFYDINGLWHKYVKIDFGIILINNGGGGIFRILPGHQENEVFNEFFETQHQQNAELLAKIYDFSYFKAQNKTDLEKCLKDIFTSRIKIKPFLLEIFTPTSVNDTILKSFFKNI